MIIQFENQTLTFHQAKIALSNVNGHLESVAALSEQLASSGENLEITSLSGMIQRRGQMLEDIIGLQKVIRSALETAGQNSPEFQHFSELTKKIRKSGDILVGVLQKRKEVVVNNIQSANNQVKLQSYAR
jgi:hypothetical protein